jgi:acyl carrier protein
MNDEAIIIRLRNLLRESSVEDRDWESVDADTTIESLGFDSLTVLDLLYDVEQEFGVVLEAQEVIGAQTMGEIVRLLQERGG